MKRGHMSSFTSFPAYKKLQELAKKPVNLSSQGTLTPQRLKDFFSEACGYRLLYGTEKIDSQVLEALKGLAEQADALKKMARMQAGEVMNSIEGFPSENRAVLHTATRDFFDHRQTSKEAHEAADLAKKEAEKLQIFLENLTKENKYSEMILVGIGGSDLGPRANYYALQHLLRPGRKVHFISNVDPDDAAQVLKEANLEKSLVVVISKSGNTLETAVNEQLVREGFKARGIDPEGRFIAVTTPKSPMDNPKKYLEVFHLWDWIGGRYSSTSMVGGVILAFAFGFEAYIEFLKGAHDMDRASLNKDLKHNPALTSALLTVWNHNFLGYPTTAIIPYSQPLYRYPAHIQQVEMESNGKRIDKHGKEVDFHTGPILWGEAGTNAQHSFFQLLHQGTDKVPLLIVGYKESQSAVDLQVEGTSSQEKLLANLWAQSLALALGQKSDNPNKVFPGDRPTSVLVAKQLTPYTLGALLSFFENRVALEGFIWGINSFDQEGVQLGKVLATKILDHLKAKKQGKPTDYALAEVFFNHLDAL